MGRDNGKGVYLYNRENDKFTQYLGDNSGETLFGENIYKMCDYGDELVIGIHEGKLRKLNKRKNILTDVNAPEVHYKIIRDVACFDDELWVGLSRAVYVINTNLKKQKYHISIMIRCALIHYLIIRSDEFIGTEKTVYGSGLIWGE